MTPERRPSASTAISAPKRRRALLASRESSGASSRTWKVPSSLLEQFGDAARSAREVSGTSSALVADDQAEEAVRRVDDREPGPAVAEEVLVEGLLDAELAGDRDRLAIHHVGDADALDPPGDRGLHRGAAGRAVDHDADQRQPDAAEDAAARPTSSEAAADEDVAEDPAEVGGEAGRGVRSPVRHQAIARTIRPPSIGKAGSRLKTRTRALIEASQAIAASDAGGTGVAFEQRPPCGTRRSRRSRGRPGRGRRRSPGSPAGPPIATLNSVAGLSDSRSIRAMPPKIQSWMLVMPIPLRIATKAWPSSCRTIEPKKPKALTSASRNGRRWPSCSRRARSPKSRESQKMTRKRTRNQDQSTAIADAADVEQGYRACRRA